MLNLKHYILTFLFCCVFTSLSAFPQQKIDSTRVDSTLVKYYVASYDNLFLGNINTIDTTTLFASYYDPLDEPFDVFQTLSNSGLAYKNLQFSYPSSLGFNQDLSTFSKYLISNKNIIYPILYQPFTEITYMMGGKKEQHLNVLFSREFLPRFFVTLQYNIDFAPAVYQRSKMQNTYFWGNMRYNTKNERYGVNGYYFHNKIDIQENGGIKYDSIFTQEIETDRSVIDINLKNASNLIKTSGFGIYQYVNLSSPVKKKKTKEKIERIIPDSIVMDSLRAQYIKNTLVNDSTSLVNDSTSLGNDSTFLINDSIILENYYASLQKIQDNKKEEKRRRIEIGRINYNFEYQRNHYIYTDKEPSSEFYQQYDPIINTTLTYDSVYFHTIKNALQWNTLGYKKYCNDIPFYLNFGVEHNYTYFGGYTEILTGEQFNKQEYSNLRATAGIIINLFKSTRVTGKGNLITNGYQAGDFMIDGQWKQFLGTYKKNIGALVFDINLTKQSPTWFQEAYYSNNIRWNNNFSPSTFMLLKGSYELPFITIGIKQTTIDHYIYFDTDAKPEQYTGTLNISSLFTTFDVKLKHLEFAGFLSLQKTDNENVVHIPNFYGKLKIGYSITLVKNISLIQPSVIINYFSKYHADAYMPATRSFYLQNDVLVGNYPYIDFCITFKIKRANVFVQYTNLYSLSKDFSYFTTPHYPMRDSRFCLGVNWRLYK